MLLRHQTRSGAETTLNLLLLAGIHLAFGMLFLAVVHQAIAVFARRRSSHQDRIALAAMALALCPFLFFLTLSP